MKSKKIEIIGIILLILGIIYIIKIKVDESDNMSLILETSTNEVIANSNNEEKATIKVHIDGQIKNRGVVELEEGSRLVDAVEKSGGLTEEADTSNINLAYVLPITIGIVALVIIGGGIILIKRKVLKKSKD